MKTKKSERADIEKYRVTFGLLGLCLTLSIVFYAFEFKSGDEVANDFNNGTFLPVDDPIMNTLRQETSVTKPLPQNTAPLSIAIVDKGGDDIFFDFGYELKEIPDVPEVEIKDMVDDPSTEVITEIPQFLAEYPGGNEALIEFLVKNIKYPEIDKDLGKTGTVFVKFIVYKNGKVGGATILRGVSETIDEEALKVISKMPDWKPARMGTVKVNSYFTMPIKFSLKS